MHDQKIKVMLTILSFFKEVLPACQLSLYHQTIVTFCDYAFLPFPLKDCLRFLPSQFVSLGILEMSLAKPEV